MPGKAFRPTTRNIFNIMRIHKNFPKRNFKLAIGIEEFEERLKIPEEKKRMLYAWNVRRLKEVSAKMHTNKIIDIANQIINTKKPIIQIVKKERTTEVMIRKINQAIQGRDSTTTLNYAKGIIPRQKKASGGKRVKVTKPQIQEIIRMHDKMNMRFSEIAPIIKLHPNTIARYYRETKEDEEHGIDKETANKALKKLRRIKLKK